MNPGSKEAAHRGCTCPVIDNNYGRGVPVEKGSPQFWISENCPIHGTGHNCQTCGDVQKRYLNEKGDHFGI